MECLDKCPYFFICLHIHYEPSRGSCIIHVLFTISENNNDESSFWSYGMWIKFHGTQIPTHNPHPPLPTESKIYPETSV